MTTTFTAELGEEICERIASGESLHSICNSRSGMPNKSTVVRWALFPERSSAEFVQQYARSRQIQAELLADELFEVADDGSNDWQEGKFGPMVNGEAVQRSRLRVDTRKWYLSKVLPKVYGDKITQEHTGEIGVRRILVPERTATKASETPMEPDFSE